MRLSSLLLSLALTPCLLTAQDAAAPHTLSSSPVTDALRQQASRFGRILVQAAEFMPADKYGYKPTPAQLSFGDIVVHLSEANDALCSAAAGTTAPTRTKVTTAEAKGVLVARLKETFAYCDASFANLTDAKLNEPVSMFGMNTTRGGMVLINVADWADHYSQQAIYMRINGELPPTARPRPTTP